jgi:hypothetical protein
LVASFRYSSFPLSEESVGVALECCLGGSASGFRVVMLSDKRFRFSVASNKVGHFIYSLRERCWPDFHCLFSLFRGDGFAACYVPKTNVVVPDLNAAWSSNGHLSNVDQSAPPEHNLHLAISPKLDILKEKAFDGSSSKELAKFNLFQDHSSGSSLSAIQSVSPAKGLSTSSPVAPPANMSFRIGEIDCSFLDNKIVNVQNILNFSTKAFIGNNFQSNWYWLARFNSDPHFSCHNLELVRDLRQAGYSDFEIQKSIGLWGLPPQVILNKLIELDMPTKPRPLPTCSNCLGLGHVFSQCLPRLDVAYVTIWATLVVLV